MKLIALIINLMAGCAFGGEVVRPGAVTMHHMPCGCGGEMKVCAGIVLTSIPPQYPHKCDKCGRAAAYDKNYPWFDVSDVEEISAMQYWGGYPGVDDSKITNVPLRFITVEPQVEHGDIQTVPVPSWEVKDATNITIRVDKYHYPGSNWVDGGMVLHRDGGIASWTEWEYATNRPERLREVTFRGNRELWATNSLGSVHWYGDGGQWGAATNGGIIYFQNQYPPCTREHWDGGEQQEVTYNQSNLLSYVSFRGQTNVQCMESLCVRTNVRTWHWQREKVYTQAGPNRQDKPK